MLHHRQQMAEMLAVMSPPPSEDRALLGRRFQLGIGEDGADRPAILVFE